MSLAKMLFEVKEFLGINNVDEASKVLPRGKRAFLTQGSNVDIDDQGMPHRRGGFAAAAYAGSRVHSLWSNGDICFFIDGADLKRLKPDFTAEVIRAGVGPGRMVFVSPFGPGRVYYTNNTVIGYVEEGGDHSFAAPTQAYKIPMPAGHLIEWFNGRLYVARKKEVWFSDPMYPGQADSRKAFKQLPGFITLMRAVRDGMFVSDGFKTYFMAGLDPQEFSLVQVADTPAIAGTDVKTDGSLVGKGTPGEVVLWLSPEGICAGGREGFFKNLTGDYYRPASQNEGAAIFRRISGAYQFLVTQKAFGGTLNEDLPKVMISAAGREV